MKKISKFDIARDADGFPLKVKEPDYLTLCYFNSLSEKERFLKN
jgi:hypothetical protein